jgi:hypothetical protein
MEPRYRSPSIFLGTAAISLTAIESSPAQNPRRFTKCWRCKVLNADRSEIARMPNLKVVFERPLFEHQLIFGTEHLFIMSITPF